MGDLNYFSNDYGMLVHMKSRLKNLFVSNWLVDGVYTNDFGAYDLIVHTFFNHKDPMLWQYLIKNDEIGVDNIAFATAKQGDKWAVNLIYYMTLESKKCPPDYYTKRDVGFQACLNKYSFYQRRWHDYDFSKGVLRKEGEGETDACTKWPGDSETDANCIPKKPLKNPPILPKSEEEDKKAEEPPKPELPPKPVVPKQGETPKNPKVPSKPPTKPEPKKRPKPQPQMTDKEKRIQADNDYLFKMKAQRDVHQVITMKKIYQWLDDPSTKVT